MREDGNWAHPEVAAGGRGCVMSRVNCKKGGRCVPKETCNLGEVIFRDRWTGGGHHHYETEGEGNECKP